MRKLKGARCLCAGISIPGRANREGRIVLMPDADIWCGCPLKEIFEEKTNITAYVDNDNNANMLASRWMNLINGTANAVFISTTEGVGIGAMISHSLFRGAKDNGPEIGHTIVSAGGRACKCGNHGCLQAYISDQAIYEDISFLLKMKYPVLLENSANLAAIAEYARKNRCNDLYASFYSVAEYISIALQNIIKTYDPAMILINSTWLRVLPEVFDHIKLRVYEYCGLNEHDDFEITTNIEQRIVDMAPSLMAFDNYLSCFEIQKPNEKKEC